ncbi:hypothetical protein HYV82_05230, partial [Candidatus Woesearchaeota archaeon]|nr:hypothetical protein [Candidatus Woesearchaeota archaeon]
MQLIIIAAALFVAAFAARTTATASCNFLSSCPSPNTSVLFVRNDTAGYLNAHAQLPTNGSYPFALCCDFGMAVSTACPGNATFLNLSNVTNAHLQAGNSTAQAYGNGVCLSTNNGSIAVAYGGCPDGYSQAASISNDTNAHIGDSNEYSLKLCIRAAIRPTPAFVSPTWNDNQSVSIRRNYSYVNISVANGTTVDTVIVNWNGSNVTLENTSFVSSLYMSPDLVLWLTLNNNTRDRSRYNNHGVQFSGVNCSASVDGVYGSGCRFYGADERINISDSNSLDIVGGNVTVLLWINKTDGNSRRFMWKGFPEAQTTLNYAFGF